MVIELYEDDRRTPRVVVAGEVLSMQADRDPQGRTPEPQRFRLGAGPRKQLTELRRAALAELNSVEDPQSLVQSVEAGYRGRPQRLVIDDGQRRREVEWSYPDRLPKPLEALYRGLEMLQRQLPVRQFERTVTRRCREAAALETGIPADQWTVASNTRELFDHHRSLPDADYSGVTTAEGYSGQRITLRHGSTLRAYHTIANFNEIHFAETWERGEFPRYAPADLDMAARLRHAGPSRRALVALAAAALNSVGGSEKSQAGLEMAEVYAQLGRLDMADKLYRDFIGAGSQDEHAIAHCGLAWVSELRKPGADPELLAIPPTRWAELEIHPWWRGDRQVVEGVPARHPALQAALETARSSHQAAWESRFRGGLGH